MDNQYMVFLDNRQFDQGNLDAHLEYLKMYNGTPDMLEAFNDLRQAFEVCDRKSETCQCRAIVYDYCKEEILRDVNFSE